MFAVGHLALGYVTGKASSKTLDLKINLPFLFAFSILPDIDLLIPYIEHRGPTHSIILTSLISLPLFMGYGKTMLPYFLAIVQHSLIGDFLTGGVQLLWPIEQTWYGLENPLLSPVNMAMEWIAFTASLTFMLRTGDFHELLKPHPLNLTLILSITTICLPMLTGLPIKVPPMLIIPHLIYLAMFTLSILRDLKAH